MTIKDVAKYCNVSATTVSRVLNDDIKVKLGTKKKVLDGIKELGYVPNAAAKNLRTDSSRWILVLLNAVFNQFYSKVLDGMESRAEESGYRTTVAATHDNPKIEKQFFNGLKMRSFDGVISMKSALDAQYLNDISANYPVVFCSEYVKNTNIPYIGIDNEKAGYDATQLYIKQGFTEIGFIGVKIEHGAAIERECGYRKALHDAKIPVKPDYIYYGYYDFYTGEMAAKYFLSLPKLPQAIFAISDNMAIGAIREFTKNGLKVGKDIYICGFDNTDLAKVYIPSLTTVSQPRFEIGYAAMDRLIRKIEFDENIEDIKLNHEIVIRES